MTLFKSLDQEALLGPAGAVNTLSWVVVAMVGSLKSTGVMRAAMVAISCPYDSTTLQTIDLSP